MGPFRHARARPFSSRKKIEKKKFEIFWLYDVMLGPDTQKIFRFFRTRSRVLMKPAPSVRLSVCNKSSHTSHHQIFLIFCIKLAYYKRKKVTKPDFRKKNVLAQNWAKWAQNGPNWGFSAIFLSLNHQISLILHIMIDSNDIQQVLVVIALKKNVPAQNGPIQACPGPPETQNFFVFNFFFSIRKKIEKKSLKCFACKMTSCWPDTQKMFRFFDLEFFFSFFFLTD